MCKLALVCVSLSYPGQLLVPDLPEIKIVNTHSDISDIDISDSDIMTVTARVFCDNIHQQLHQDTETQRHARSTQQYYLSNYVAKYLR